MKILSNDIKDQIIKEVSLAISQQRFDDIFAIGHEHLHHESEIDQKSILKNLILYVKEQYWPIPLSIAFGGIMALASSLPGVKVPQRVIDCGNAIVRGNEDQLRLHLLDLPPVDQNASQNSKFKPPRLTRS